MSIMKWIIDQLIKWLIQEKPAIGMPLCNFRRIRSVIKPGDVVLVEGRSRSSSIIKVATQSPWSHAALCIGPLNQIQHPATRRLIRKYYDGPAHRLLAIEVLMYRGVVVSDMQNEYGRHHLRICRPTGLSFTDSQKVLHFAAKHLGCNYDFRHLIDLTRYLLPYHILPRRWGSRLYRYKKNDFSKTVCSSMLARAFMSVSFPIIPLLKRNQQGELILYRRNFRIMTPRDFDVSPYFDIVKYPLLGANDINDYRNLPWNVEGKVCNGDDDCFVPELSGGSLGGTISWGTARIGFDSVTTKLGNIINIPLPAFSIKRKERKGSPTQHRDEHRNNGEA